MVDTPEAVGPLLERCREASMAELEAGTISAQLSVRHRYLDPVPVDVTVGMGGGCRTTTCPNSLWEWEAGSTAGHAVVAGKSSAGKRSSPS